MDNSSGVRIQARAPESRLPRKWPPPGVSALLTGHCGPKAHQVLTAAGITIYNNVEGTVTEAVARFNAGDFTASRFRMSKGTGNDHHGGQRQGGHRQNHGGGEPGAAGCLRGYDVHLCDCDVEEPNAHLFLNPEFTDSADCRTALAGGGPGPMRALRQVC